MAATPTSLTLERRLRRQLAQILDAQTRELVRSWAIAWDEIAPEVRDTLGGLLAQVDAGTTAPAALLARSTRLQAALTVIADNLGRLAPAAGIRINADLTTVVSQAAEAQVGILAAMLPAGQDLFDVSRPWRIGELRDLQAIVRRSGEQITSLARPLAPDAYQAVRRELVRGVAVGANPRATAARMVERAESEFNGGLTRALTISRTETLDAHRAAAAVGQARHPEVLAGWVWMCALSPRTCRACLAMHGREFPLEEPGPIGHQQCRCARSPLVKPWSDLGFDVEEPPSAVPDAVAYFERLTPDQQRAILGRKGYEAWLAGDFPPEEWAKRRETEGWRDAVVPAAPGDAGGRGDGPPGAPPSTPLDHGDDELPIGPVLGTPEQQTYFEWPTNPMPADHELDLLNDPNADNAFTFVADPDARARALLQYERSTARLAKELAFIMDEGEAPDSDWQRRVGGVYRQVLQAWPRFGIEGDNYTVDDFVTDLTYTANWLLDRAERTVAAPGPLYRGLSIPGVFDLSDRDDLGRLLSWVQVSLGFASATQLEDYARYYALERRSDTSVVLEIVDAVGIRMDGVGRMSNWPEYLLSGGLERVAYFVKDDVLYLLMRHLP